MPKLLAYNLDFAAPPAHFVGDDLVHRFSRTFGGKWYWVGGQLLTNSPVSPVQLEITLDVMRDQFPALYGQLEHIEADPKWRMTPLNKAKYVIATAVQEAESDIRTALSAMGQRIPNGYILRDYHTEPWMVDGAPALSLSLKAYVAYDRNAQQYISQTSAEALVGLQVMDRTGAAMVGIVTGVAGTLGALRDSLLDQTHRDIMRRLLQKEADDVVVVTVEAQGHTYTYPASALRVLVRPAEPDDWERLKIPADVAMQALHLAPDVRSGVVKTISDVLKKRGIVDNAYNSRQNDFSFTTIDFMPSLVFAKQRVRPYNFDTLATDFVQNGLFERHPRFDDNPIRLGIINTLDDGADDFVEALRRQIEKDFDYRIDLIKQRNVRVVNDKNLASAVRVVEKENPHVVLAFFPDAASPFDPNYETLKSLTLGKGIASHAVYETTMHNPDAMATVIMSLMAKTGNVPFALAEPLEYADFVVGLDLVREQLTRGDRVVAMARIYRNDGAFQQFLMDTIELDTDDPIPLTIWQTLFPEAIFADKRIILHHDGVLADDVLQRLDRWARVLNCRFLPVEILREEVPRLYGIESGVTQAPWGSVFYVNDQEAFVVSSAVVDDGTAMPLHVRVTDASLPIEQAIYSVLAWTLLHYGTLGTPKLPVTVQHAEDMAQWLARGMLPENTAGDTPFWL